MADRVIRDELLTSDRYWGCSAEARNLYVSILLSADDCGRYTGANFALRVRCMAGTVDADRVEKLLLELVDVDLIRLYEANSARFIFVPRFRQRMRYTRSKYPAPPHEINDLPEKSQTQDGPASDQSQTQVCRREVKRSKTTPYAPNAKIAFDAERGWLGISDDDRLLWQAAYPAIDVKVELAKARVWLLSNPKNRKGNYRRFLTNWFARSQDRAPRVVDRPTTTSRVVAL